MNLSIGPVGYSTGLFGPLLCEAESGDGVFLLRLRDEWEKGSLRFEGRGETLLGAFVDGQLVAVGGISHDPYAPEAGLGRIRHVYVLKPYRSQGIGNALVSRLIAHGHEHFAALRLTTETEEAARLYERLGFVRCEASKQTHRLAF